MPTNYKEFSKFTKGQYTGAGHQAARGKAWRGFARQQGISTGGHSRSITQRTNYLRQLQGNGNTPKWMNNWLPNKVPPGYNVDHYRALFDNGLDIPSNMRLKLISDHIARHRYYRP